MDNERRERLEQELKFLEESLEADVISRDEYERGKERIERKLKEIEERPEEKVEEKKGEIEEERLLKSKISKGFEKSNTFQNKPEEKEEIKAEPEIEIKEIKEKPTKIIGAGEEESREKEEDSKIEEKKEEIEEEKEEEITISKKWLYSIAILIIVVILFFSIRGCKTGEEETAEEGPTGEIPTEKFVPECSSNSDCKQAGMVGTCLSPGTKEAKCEFKEDARTELVLINDKDCKLCDSSGMKTIVKGIFPNVKIRDIDYEAAEAKKLVEEFNINALPAYIFDSNVGKAINFDDFKSALIKKENNYVMTKTASGASYYFKRPLIKNKLDLYILPGTNEKIEASVQEVLDLFKDKINFTKHIVTKGQEEVLEKELGINTYPAFLLNNQLKFRGILPADIIKENICKVNYFEECSKELSKV